MPSAAAARRASYRSSGAQHERPERVACSSVEYSRSEIPSTPSLPRRSATSAAATEESTPPDIATTASRPLPAPSRFMKCRLPDPPGRTGGQGRRPLSGPGPSSGFRRPLWLRRNDEARHLELLAVDGLAAPFEGREVDQVVDGPREALRGGGDRLQDPLLLIGQRPGLPSAQDLQVADDGGQGRRHLVRQVLHELVLASRRRPQPGVGRGQLAHRGLEPLDQRLAVFAQVPTLLRSADLLPLALQEGAQLLR